MGVLKKFAVFLGQFILIAFLALIAREAWGGYVQEKENEQFAREGIPVTVQINRILKDKRDWKDYIGYSKYIAFGYQGKSYDLRFLPDSGWVGEGTRVLLLYSPSLDRFVQPGRLRHTDPNGKVSKLIDWTVIGTFSPAHTWLFVFLALSTFIALFGFSVLFNLTSITLFDFLAGIFKWVAALGLLTYFTWNVLSNYYYYKRVKTGTIRSARITGTEKNHEFNDPRTNSIKLYYYTAFTPDATAPDKTRRFMISGRDYEKFHKGDFLPVYYQSSMDEIMSLDYSFDISNWVFLAMIWVLALYFISGAVKPKKQP